MDVEAEILDLKRRMTLLENEVKADHDFSVKLFIQIRHMREDIALLRSHAVVMDKRVEHLEERMGRVESDLAALRSEFNAFRQELPGLIADTMREVLGEMRNR
jgi:chromosome segregation ATPase